MVEPSRAGQPFERHRRAEHDSSFDDDLIVLARRLPKAEPHMHLTGSLVQSEFIIRTTEREGSRPELPRVDRAYDNLGPEKFFADLDVAARLWDDPERLEEATVATLTAAFDHGARHVELLCTPALHLRQAGMLARESLRAVDAAITSVRANLGMSSGIVVELHRPDGAAAAVALVKETIRLRDEGLAILGVGNDGNHRTLPLRTLQDAYSMAKAAGLRLTGHTMSLDDVRFALEAGFHRLDHGWLAASHPDLVSRIANAGSVMTFTPMAYVLGGHKADIAWHQAYSALTAAGIPVVIGTDDPALHHTDITHSYEIVARRLGWDGSDLASAARASFLHSWSSSGDRPAIERNLAEIDRLVIAPRGGREANDDQAGSASRSAG